MIATFPTVEDDELLYSACARFRRLFGFAKHRPVSTVLFGTRNRTALVALPSAIDRLIERLPHGASYTAESLIEDHTLLPYFARFVDGGLRTSAVLAMRSDERNYINNLLGLGRHNPSPSHLQFCVACAKEDATRVEAYWHRAHQLPGVLVCPRHGCGLWRGQIRRTDMKGVFAYHALAELTIDSAKTLVLPRVAPELLLRLAKMSEWVLTAPPQPLGREALLLRLRELLGDFGWLCKDGRSVRLGALSDALVGAFGRELLSEWNCRVTDNPDHGWLQHHCTTRPRKHPLPHLLLLAVMGPSVVPADLFRPLTRSANQNPSSGRERTLRHGRRWWTETTHPAAVYWPGRDEDWLPIVRIAARALLQDTEELVKLTVASIGREAGVRQTLVTHRKDLPRVHEYLASVVETDRDFTVRRIAWWAVAYARQGEPAPSWVLQERAGVSRPTIPVFASVLQYYSRQVSRALEGGREVSRPPTDPMRLRAWAGKLLTGRS